VTWVEITIVVASLLAVSFALASMAEGPRVATWRAIGIVALATCMITSTIYVLHAGGYL